MIAMTVLSTLPIADPPNLPRMQGAGAASQIVSYQFGTEQGETTALSKEFSHSAHNSFALGFGIGPFGLNFGVSGKVSRRFPMARFQRLIKPRVYVTCGAACLRIPASRCP